MKSVQGKQAAMSLDVSCKASTKVLAIVPMDLYAYVHYSSSNNTFIAAPSNGMMCHFLCIIGDVKICSDGWWIPIVFGVDLLWTVSWYSQLNIKSQSVSSFNLCLVSNWLSFGETSHRRLGQLTDCDTAFKESLSISGNSGMLRACCHTHSMGLIIRKWLNCRCRERIRRIMLED